MQQTIVNLKQRIENNYKRIQSKFSLSKLALKMINNLLDTNATNKEIHQWLTKHENIIYVLEYNLEIIEQNHNLKNTINHSIQRIEKYKDELQTDNILIETILSVLEYLLSEDLPNEQIKSLYGNISSSIKMLEEKIDKLKKIFNNFSLFHLARDLKCSYFTVSKHGSERKIIQSGKML